MPPRTIDNLGVEVSTRWAEDKQILDESLIKEARSVSLQTGIDVTSPFISAELDALLHLQPTGMTWASFIPPDFYFEQRKRLFTYQLIPSMGSEDKQESQALKILAKIKDIEQQAGNVEQSDKRQQFEQMRALEEEEKEKKILTSLLDTIALFDKLIIEINSRRTQYQKG